MKRTSKRVWTDEQRQAAAERMRKMQQKKRETRASVALLTRDEAQKEVNAMRSKNVDRINERLMQEPLSTSTDDSAFGSNSNRAIAQQKAVAEHGLQTKQQVVENAITESRQTIAEGVTPPVVEVARSPEVQAIIDTMDPQRKAKLASIQSRTLASLTQTKEGQEALERLEARKTPESKPEASDVAVVASTVIRETFTITPEPPKPVVQEISYRVPFRLTGTVNGQMISEFGPCICGEAKLKWHPVCLKVKVNG